MSKAKILVIVGTTRQGRSGRKIADWYLAEAKKVAPSDIELELYDIADLKLPIFDEPVSPMMHQYTDLQNKIANVIGAADGFVFVTGEYNHTIPGSLVNFMDFINAEWGHKPAAFVSYGTHGGVRSIEHMVPLLAELHVTGLSKSSDMVAIRTPWLAIDDQGSVKPEFVQGDIAGQLKELNWWTQALKVARG
jgi:NAD(P)H-dependent FMN reductase